MIDDNARNDDIGLCLNLGTAIGFIIILGSS